MKLTSRPTSNFHRVLGFGGPKSGKTKLAAMLSESYRLIFFDLENGINTALQLPLEWQERIYVVSIPDTKAYPIAIETMLKVFKYGETEICVTHGKVGCFKCKQIPAHWEIVNLSKCGPDHIVVVDSLTQLANSAMAHICKNMDDEYKATWEDFRVQGQLMDRFLSEVQQAPFNVVCLTHEIEAELEDGRKKLVPIAGTTNFSRNTAKYFDHVVYCELNSKQHKFGSSTTYAASVLTGSRTNVALEKDSVPSLLTIFGKRVPDATDPDSPAKTIEKIPESKNEVPGQTSAPVASTSALLMKLKAEQQEKQK